MSLQRVLVCLLAGTLIAADAPKKDDTAQDVGRFQGTLILQSLENNGLAADPESLRGRKLIVSGNDSTFVQDGKVYSQSTQKLDASKTPRQLDIIQVAGAEKGKVTKGIYMLERDELTICYVYPGDGRPVDFKAGKDTGCILLKFRREKR